MAIDHHMEPILLSLDELRLNNQKTWFDQHRADYDAARNTFEQFIDALIGQRLPAEGGRLVTALCRNSAKAD